MKLMHALVLTLSLFLLPGGVFATSIVYNGFGCLNSVSVNDPTPDSTPVQSKFEVIDDAGDGVYRLNLTGGIPRFVNDNHNVCIDSATVLGYSGIPDLDGLPRPLESIDATAYFNGQDLMIVISSLYTDLSAQRNPLSSFTTSRISAFTHTLILEFNPQSSSFGLKKVIRNRGLTYTIGSTNLITTFPFLETVLPSFNETAQDKPRILTPVSSIEFVLE